MEQQITGLLATSTVLRKIDNIVFTVVKYSPWKNFKIPAINFKTPTGTWVWGGSDSIQSSLLCLTVSYTYWLTTGINRFILMIIAVDRLGMEFNYLRNFEFYSWNFDFYNWNFVLLSY